MKNPPILSEIKQKCSLILVMITLSFPVFAQEVEDILPESFYGNWVEDLSECESGSYFSIAESEIGLFVFGLGWSSTEVKVENTGEYYTLFVDAVAEGGEFQSEIKVKMGEDGNLFFIDSGSEEKELVKCDPTEFFEYESEEMTLEDEGLEVEELDMENTIDLVELGSELPVHFYGNWVEDISQCEGVPPFSLDYSDGGVLVSGLDWYSTEVKVTYQDDYYSLTIKGLSEEGEFETEIIIGMDEEENLIVSTDGGETGSKLVKCDPIANEELVELSEEEMTLGDVGLEVEELDMGGTMDLEVVELYLPSAFYGYWVEDVAQCEVAPILSIVDSEEGLTVSSIDWSSSVVKVTFKDGIYTLFLKGVSEEGDFETEMFIRMDEEGNIWVGFGEEELENKLMKCELLENEEFIEIEMEDAELEVEEFDRVDTLSLENINIELLQGKWQSLEDGASFLVIEGDRMKNYYGGLDDELDNEMIMISDTCMNEADSANGLPEEKSRYLSNPNLDMCWYIEFVDSTSLSLIYMATGNTLTYRRIE